jgi:PAS domain S-box-containing protein
MTKSGYRRSEIGPGSPPAARNRRIAGHNELHNPQMNDLLTPSGEPRLSPANWYDLVVEASADGSWLWDIDRDELHYSPRLLDILNFPVPEGKLKPREVFDRICPEDRERYKSALTAHLKGQGAVLETEVRVRNSSGEPRWMLIRGVARRESSGRAYCIPGPAIDITARRQLGDSLRTVALSTTEGAGPEFFASLVRYLATTLESDFAFIAIPERSALMRDYERSRRQLVELKERAPGLRIAIDDFGSGYSSLSHLRHLPIDTLKIDRSFVADLDRAGEATARAIAKTIIEFGRNLGLSVVAEGVEHALQAEWLESHGCHEAQGFLYDRALPGDEFELKSQAAARSSSAASGPR